MGAETHLERRLDRLVAQAENPRKAAVVIATVTTAITVAAGVAMTLVDHKGFPTVGSGLWWAVQTVTTVGYGDHVPKTVAGQLMAAAVMLLGIGFVTVITASITSAFVARNRREKPADRDRLPAADQLEDIIARLERIESTLNRPG